MVKKSKSSFRGKVGANAQKTSKSGASYGHLRLPKGVPVFTPEPECTIKLDFMPYVVTDSKHPDKDTNSRPPIPGWRHCCTFPGSSIGSGALFR